MPSLHPIIGNIFQSTPNAANASVFGGSFKPVGEVPETFVAWVQVDADDLPRRTQAFKPGWLYQFFVNPECPYAERIDWFRVLAAPKASVEYSILSDLPDAQGVRWSQTEDHDSSSLVIEMPIAEDLAMGQEEAVWDLFIPDSDVFRCPDTGFSYFRWSRDTERWSLDVDFA